MFANQWPRKERELDITKRVRISAGTNSLSEEKIGS